jgi:transketolase
MATGVMTTNCLAAAEILAKDGVDAALVHFHTIKPLDGAAVLEFARDAELVVTVEEGIRIGGFGSAVADHLLEHGAAPALMRLGLPDAFPDKYGVQDDLFRVYGLRPDQIAAAVGAAARKLRVA